MQPTVLVMMRPTVAPPRDTECMDVPGGPQTETFFTKDLRDAHRGPLPDRARGQELGRHRRLHRRLLRAEDDHAPPRGVLRRRRPCPALLRRARDATTGDLFGGNSAAAAGEQPDVAAAAPAASAGEPAGHQQQAGRGELPQDPAVHPAERRPPSRISSIILDSGGHNFNTWGREIPAALEWLGNHLKA